VVLLLTDRRPAAAAAAAEDEGDLAAMRRLLPRVLIFGGEDFSGLWFTTVDRWSPARNGAQRAGPPSPVISVLKDAREGESMQLADCRIISRYIITYFRIIL